MQATETHSQQIEHCIGHIDIPRRGDRPITTGVYVDQWEFSGRTLYTPRCTAGLGGRDFATMRGAVAYAQRALPAMVLEAA